jgi:transketolase
MGGSADLDPSTHTSIGGAGSFEPESLAGRNMHFGIREHAMGAILNGVALHRGLIPYGGTFLIFSDYMRPPMRLAAMTGLPVIYVFTHDSIAMGVDGPMRLMDLDFFGSPHWDAFQRQIPISAVGRGP